MLIRAGYDIRLETNQPVPMLANLSIHPSRNKDLRTAQRIMTRPDVPIYDYMDGFGNVCTRLTIPAGGITISTGFVIEDPSLPDAVAPIPTRIGSASARAISNQVESSDDPEIDDPEIAVNQ